MFLLVSGASGTGKSTARRLAAPELEPWVDCVELHDVVPMPRVPTLAWRQRATEAVVCHALELQEQGRHVLLAGDPVAAGELLAAPSADRLDGIAVCLLDVDRDTQADRLLARGDDPALLVQHAAFADWMRGHAADSHHRPEVVQTNGWEQMRWERWSRLDDAGTWRMQVLDCSSLTAKAHPHVAPRSIRCARVRHPDCSKQLHPVRRSTRDGRRQGCSGFPTGDPPRLRMLQGAPVATTWHLADAARTVAAREPAAR